MVEEMNRSSERGGARENNVEKKRSGFQWGDHEEEEFHVYHLQKLSLMTFLASEGLLYLVSSPPQDKI